MPTFVALMSYTEQGIRHIKQSPKRLDAAKAMLEEMGGSLRHFLMTMGQYDLVVIYEAPDDAVAARFTLLLSSEGNVRTLTMKAFPEGAYREIVGSL